jgi:hypothetical protein
MPKGKPSWFFPAISWRSVLPMRSIWQSVDRKSVRECSLLATAAARD